MAAPWTSLATKTLADRMAADRKFAAFDPTILFEVIREAITLLAKCKPDPSEGYAHLTWKPEPRPWLDWLLNTSPAERQWEHREKIIKAMYAKWTRSRGEFHAFVQSLWDAVDAGDLSFDLVAGMYQEARK